MIKQILVGIDFSEASREALQAGIYWSQHLGATLVALHVVHMARALLEDGNSSSHPKPWIRELKDSAFEMLQTLTQGDRNISPRVVFGSPAEELVAAADPETLMILGQESHPGLGSLVLGSTGAQVVGRAPCEVLVVRHAPPALENGFHAQQ